MRELIKNPEELIWAQYSALHTLTQVCGYNYLSPDQADDYDRLYERFNNDKNNEE